MTICIKELKKSFQESSKPVLDGINLSLSKGDFCVVIGSNGSGKSTLLKLISKEYKADSGSVEVDGPIAQVVQDVNRGTVPEMTLMENIALSEIKRPKLLFYNRYKGKAIQTLKRLNIGLEKYINYPLKTLSGGQRQMIATLMAIQPESQVLLLDEHTSALDPKMQDLLIQYTAEKVAELKLTTVMVTHKMNDAIKYGNRLIMLHKGKIVLDAQGKQKEVLRIQDLLLLFHKYEDQVLRYDNVCNS